MTVRELFVPEMLFAPGSGVRLDESVGSRYEVKVLGSLEEGEAVWRTLESEGVLTPYQRYDWVRAVVRHHIPSRRLAVAVLFESGRPVCLLPFAVDSFLGLYRARIAGSELGNCDWIVQSRAAPTQITKSTLQWLFCEVRSQIGDLDLIEFRHLRKSWQGIRNPLLEFRHQPSPDHFYFGSIVENSPIRIDSKRRRNLLRGKRRLSEIYGPVRLSRAVTPDELRRVHTTFLKQRGARFSRMGVENIFAKERFVSFFRQLGEESAKQSKPTLALHALYAGEAIVAVSCGTYFGSHYSQYINSTALGQAGKYSLMGILMIELLDNLRAEGIKTIDLGMGDFDYKAEWTDKERVYDSFIPLTPQGEVGVSLLSAAGRTKRFIKQNPGMWSCVRRARRALRSGDSERESGISNPAGQHLQKV